MSVQWTPPPVPNGIITGYRVSNTHFLEPVCLYNNGYCFILQVYYTPMKSYMVNDTSYNSSQQQIDVTATQVTLTGLYPATTYQMYVTAFNGAGEGNRSLTAIEDTFPARKIV